MRIAQRKATSFLIEFRLRGYAKNYAKWAAVRILREAKRLRIKQTNERRFVSHITLFGPAKTTNLGRVIREVQLVGRRYTLVPFRLCGVSKFDNSERKVVILCVEPSSELEQFRSELSSNLMKVSFGYPKWDLQQDFGFHSTLGIFEPSARSNLDRLYDYAETQCNLDAFRQCRASLLSRMMNFVKRHFLRKEQGEELGINQHLLRVTVLGKWSRIQSEYDLVLRKMLSRIEATSGYWWRKTVEELRKLQSLERAKRAPEPGRPVYLIGDTHFDHRNIIKYCHRPFSDVDQMNNVIVCNWNSTVGDRDSVYFLGDWAFGSGHRPIEYWQGLLKGAVVSIRGRHDTDAIARGFARTKVLQVNGYSFLLIHNPEDRRTKWHGWIIHGHCHNNNLDKYPFINGERKTINVSAEVVGYKPVALSYLLSLDLDSIKRMRTIDDAPERW